MTSVWLGPGASGLALIRRVRLNGTEAIQGCILDWPRVRQWLLGEVKDLLPSAQLEPRTAPARGEEYLLASLPLRLIPGALANPPEGSAQFLPGLAAAWGGILLAISAMVALFVGTLALSERRATFVSAVTHELRTPLTTFRMYTEMLAKGMVSNEKQRDYLDTLHREANRLGHLVENVLAYARLQRGRKTRKLGGTLQRFWGSHRIGPPGCDTRPLLAKQPKGCWPSLIVSWHAEFAVAQRGPKWHSALERRWLIPAL